MVVPSSTRSNKDSQNARRFSGSTAEVGSSRNSSSGLCKVAFNDVDENELIEKMLNDEKIFGRIDNLINSSLKAA